MDVSRLNRLLITFGPDNRRWCCERCRAAAYGVEHADGTKHLLHHPGESHTDLPELDAKDAERRGRQFTT
jgi:hypothetical protein